MAVKNYTDEQIEKMSMLELADLILTDEKSEMKFLDLFNKVAEAKELTESQKEDLLARFYTDLNVDGRFTTLGSNVWGLKKWYPVEQTIEKSLAESRKRDAEEKALRDEFAHEEDVSEEDDEDDEEKEYQDYDDLQMGEDEE
ncbi:MAG TPA: DNA-directed RNA polymerase subunit delta [Pseudogracilibacillus sp.]|nr:DNA-directed RNA polymerase subunit delta [Pseudogracilibacillus sp.]